SICSLFSYLALPLPPISTPFPYTTLFRSSSLQVTARTSVPDWVRARALSVYILVFFGSMAAGGALWGFVASQASIPLALFAAAGCLLLGLLLSARFTPPVTSSEDLAPSLHWPAPILA